MAGKQGSGDQLTKAKKEVIEVYHDPDGNSAGKPGCYRARLASDHRIHDAGATIKEALDKFVVTAKSLGHPDKLGDYQIEHV